jgi:hypothetical protein
VRVIVTFARSPPWHVGCTRALARAAPQSPDGEG